MPVMAGGLATLINPYGDKVVVEVNSQTAQEYFGENFALYEEETLVQSLHPQHYLELI